MKTYTLKLKTASTTNYSLYDGTTLVTDANLTTLFATAGEAFFTIDLNSLTPTNLTSLTIVNSSDTAVMTNTGLTLVDGKNFKGEWGASATTFTSFTQLSAYGLDESQLTQLVGKIAEGKIIRKELNAGTYTAYSVFGGLDALGKLFYVQAVGGDVRLDFGTSGKYQIKISGSYSGGGGLFILFTPRGTFASNAGFFAFDGYNHKIYSGYWDPTSPIGNPQISELTLTLSASVETGVIDNLSGTQTTQSLSANQGKVLNDKIGGDLSNLDTTAKTSLIAAINEIVGDIGDVESALNLINNGGVES